jgi:hypothetical protein
LLTAFLRGKIAALAGLPRMLRKRTAIQTAVPSALRRSGRTRTSLADDEAA